MAEVVMEKVVEREKVDNSVAVSEIPEEIKQTVDESKRDEFVEEYVESTKIRVSHGDLAVGLAVASILLGDDVPLVVEDSKAYIEGISFDKTMGIVVELDGASTEGSGVVTIAEKTAKRLAKYSISKVWVDNGKIYGSGSLLVRGMATTSVRVQGNIVQTANERIIRSLEKLINEVNKSVEPVEVDFNSLSKIIKNCEGSTIHLYIKGNRLLLIDEGNEDVQGFSIAFDTGLEVRDDGYVGSVNRKLLLNVVKALKKAKPEKVKLYAVRGKPVVFEVEGTSHRIHVLVAPYVTEDEKSVQVYVEALF